MNKSWLKYFFLLAAIVAISMLSEPRAINYLAVIEWPPFEIVPFRVTDSQVRYTYNRLFDINFPFEAYRNLELQGDDFCLSSRGENGAVSSCRFGSNSISFQEDKPNSVLTVDSFAALVEAVLAEFAAACQEGDDAPVKFPIFCQRCRISCLSQPNQSSTPLELLAGRLANVINETSVFGRPPQHFGVRFRFPPIKLPSDEGGSESHDNFTAIRFETYSEDPTQVWMEVAATHFFPKALDLAEPQDRRTIADRIRTSYRFLTGECKEFLDIFDKPKSSDGEI